MTAQHKGVFKQGLKNNGKYNSNLSLIIQSFDFFDTL